MPEQLFVWDAWKKSEQKTKFYDAAVCMGVVSQSLFRPEHRVLVEIVKSFLKLDLASSLSMGMRPAQWWRSMPHASQGSDAVVANTESRSPCTMDVMRWVAARVMWSKGSSCTWQTVGISKCLNCWFCVKLSSCWVCGCSSRGSPCLMIGRPVSSAVLKTNIYPWDLAIKNQSTT